MLVLRFSAEEVMANPDAVVTEIVAAMKARYESQRSRPRPNQAPRGYSR